MPGFCGGVAGVEGCEGICIPPIPPPDPPPIIPPIPPPPIMAIIGHMGRRWPSADWPEPIAAERIIGHPPPDAGALAVAPVVGPVVCPAPHI
jgi:hypothetical protein